MNTTLPLKFKLWDSRNEHMSTVFQITDGKPDIISTPSPIGHPAPVLTMIQYDPKVHRVLQASGYVDSEGNDVYECDVLEFEDDRMGFVVFNTGLFLLTFGEVASDDEEALIADPLHVHLDGRVKCKVVGSALMMPPTDDDDDQKEKEVST